MSEIRPVEWVDGGVKLLDQRKLPHEEVYRTLTSSDEVAAAITAMEVRGAPAIGCAAAFGLVLAAGKPDFEEAALRMARARPTAVNLGWAVDRMTLRHATALAKGDDPVKSLLHEACSIAAEDEWSCRAIGQHGAPMVPRAARILTHCNAGALATYGYGTALGVIRAAYDQDPTIHVLVDETRPYLQGARLTAWELSREGIPHTLITDGMAAHFMARGMVDLVVVGADRITMRGDVANKIGTYGLAVLAQYHDVPFYVAAPTSTLDPQLQDGAAIPIEERAGREVTEIWGRGICPPGTPAAHPAFDVTPAALVRAIITEQGVLHPPFWLTVPAVLGLPPIDPRSPPL